MGKNVPDLAEDGAAHSVAVAVAWFIVVLGVALTLFAIMSEARWGVPYSVPCTPLSTLPFGSMHVAISLVRSATVGLLGESVFCCIPVV